MDVDLGVDVGLGVAVELPPQAANKKAAATETMPNIQIRFLVTEYPLGLLLPISSNA